MSSAPGLRPEGIDPTFSAPVKFCIFNIAWTFLAGEITGNVSQVDRVWTFLPVFYSAYWSLYLPLYGNEDNQWVKEQGVTGRGVLMLALQSRANEILGKTKTTVGQFFGLRFRVGYSAYSTLASSVRSSNLAGWLALIRRSSSHPKPPLLPAHHALFQHHLPLTTSDYVLAFLTLCNLAIQFTADNQQHAFQSYKHSHPPHNARAGETQEDKQPGPYGPRAWPGARIEWTDEDVKRGFITKGLWAWSRHPNFICEQMFWFLQALFPILASTTGQHTLSDTAKHADVDTMTPLWPLVPPLALSGLFIASTMFTESISKSKYPAYEVYQARVGMFSPSDTFWKGLFLWARGRLDKVNTVVYGGKGHVKAE
ncbi:hypothetical protein FRC10_007938 [Ceratobasidium sp. 414]|nr:hypothetical protein FRC10_007938 [Ceratobasidium sp. 414]